METSLDLTTLYTLPDSENFDNLYDIGYGEYAVAIDGQIVAGRNYDQKVPTASTAKMILSLAVMQEKPFLLGESGEDIEITQDYYDKYVWYYNNGGSVSEVEVGEIISEYDALTSTLIVSSNNMADTLAVWAFGSIDNYRDYSMNMLNEWGINTVTIGADASGFDDSTTATAEDLAKIGTKILENPVLREIVSLEEYTIPVAGKLENTNKLIGKNRISGIKTGYIGDASGYCLISGYFENDDHIVTLSLLGAPSRYQSFSDSLALIYQIQNNLSPKKVLSSGDIVGQYDSWWTGKVNIISDEDL